MKRLALGLARLTVELALGALLYPLCGVILARDLIVAHWGYWRGFLKCDPR